MKFTTTERAEVRRAARELLVASIRTEGLRMGNATDVEFLAGRAAETAVRLHRECEAAMRDAEELESPNPVVRRIAGLRSRLDRAFGPRGGRAS